MLGLNAPLDIAMVHVSRERLAQISIAVLFLIILRTLGEYYRVRVLFGIQRGLTAFQPFILGLVLAVIGLALAVALYFGGRFRLVVWSVGMTTAILLIYKIVFI